MTENGSQLNENPPETLTVHSALERCVDYIGRVDIDFICALARVDKAEAFQSLKGAIYYKRAVLLRRRNTFPEIL